MLIARHARRRMRLYGLTVNDVALTIAAPDHIDRDLDGNTRYWRGHHVHPNIRVVVAADDPERVLSVHPRRRLPTED